MAGKRITTKTYPSRASNVSDLVQRVEPLLTVEKLKSRYLRGVNLTLPNGDVITDDDLQDKIMLATNETEILVGVPVEPIEYSEKIMFDLSLYKKFIHIKTNYKPIIEVKRFAIESADRQILFDIPLEWVEISNGAHGQLNVVPYLTNYGGKTVSALVSNAGVAFLATLGDGVRWVPGYWRIEYIAGMCNKSGQVPVVANELIGTLAAMHLLSMLAPADNISSTSLGQDGISQSTGRAGIDRYRIRMEELEKKKEELVAKLRKVYYKKYYIGEI